MGFEGWNFYEDQVVRDQNIVERQEERDAIDERLERREVSQETLWGIESVQADVEQQENILKMLEKFKNIADKKDIDGYDVFENFLISANTDVQKNFLDRTNARNLKETIENSKRFPTSEFEFQQSLVEGTILEQLDQTEEQLDQTEEQLDQTEEQVDQTEEQVDQRSIELVSIGKNIMWMSRLASITSLISDFSKYKKLIEKGDLSKDEADFIEKTHGEIILHMQENNYLEKNILPEAYAQWPEVFSQITEQLASLDPTFQARIDAWKMTSEFEGLPPEQMIRVSGALGTRVDEVGDKAEQSGNIFTLREADGVQVDYDVVRNERSLELDGYSISSQVEDAGDYQIPKLEYMRVEQAHLPNLQRLAAAGNILEQEQVSDDDITKIKDILKWDGALGYSYYTQLGIDTMQTSQEIKNVLQEEYNTHNTAIETAREIYRNELLSLRNGYMAALEQKDKRVKQTLRFLESIGFTQIPRYITDQIIDTMNSNSGLRAQLGFTEKINFENGQIGMDKNSGESGEIDLLDQVAFAQFVNQMIWEEAINIEALQNGTGAPVGDRRRFKTILRESWLMDVGGIGVAMDNLTQNQKNK